MCGHVLAVVSDMIINISKFTLKPNPSPCFSLFNTFFKQKMGLWLIIICNSLQSQPDCYSRKINNISIAIVRISAWMVIAWIFAWMAIACILAWIENRKSKMILLYTTNDTHQGVMMDLYYTSVPSLLYFLQKQQCI